MTEPQQEGLNNFTVQRDTLQKEVAGLLVLRDNLTKSNTELNTANSSLVEELVANQIRMKDEVGAANSELESIKVDIAKEDNNLKFILQRKSEVLGDIEQLTAMLAGLNDAIAKAKDDTMDVLSNLVGVSVSVNDHLGVVTKSSTEVAQSSKEALQMIDSFKSFAVTQEAELADKKAKLDAREAQLNERQGAIDATYGSLLREMDLKAINLSELKEVN